MSKSNKSNPSKNHIKKFEEGQVVALVFRGNIPDGSFPHLYYETGRLRAPGKYQKLSPKLYSRDVEAQCKVARQAAEWIEEHPEAADGPVQERSLQAAA